MLSRSLRLLDTNIAVGTISAMKTSLLRCEKHPQLIGKSCQRRAFQIPSSIVCTSTRTFHHTPAMKRKEPKLPQAEAKKRRERKERWIRKREMQKSKTAVVTVYKDCSVKDLAQSARVGVEDILEAIDIISPGLKMRPNTVLTDIELICEIVKKLGLRWAIGPNLSKVENVLKEDKDEYRSIKAADRSQLPLRPPIVTIMGHVDHGKTTLLDSLRKTSVAAGEAGGITQSIGAFSVKVPSGKSITFLDTPGHAAFSAMRQRGAELTDLVVLVVAADDGVMEQTVESLEMARTAGVPIIVAVNKCDLENIQVEKVLKELSSHGLTPEQLGGSTQTVYISAKTGKGIDELVENIVVQSDLMEIRSDHSAKVEGVVIESRVRPGLGSIANAVVQEGTLKKGMFLVGGSSMAKVKALLDEKENRLQACLPGQPVTIAGWKSLPSAGDIFLQVDSESRAREVVRYRESLTGMEKEEEEQVRFKKLREQQKQTLSQIKDSYHLTKQIREAVGKAAIALTSTDESVPELSVVIKADVDGSLDALLNVLQSYDSDDQCRLKIIDCGVGSITESDIVKAQVFGGSVISFNMPTSREITTLAASSGVTISFFDVIYHLVAHIKECIIQRLPKEKQYDIQGEATVLQVFPYKVKREVIEVAGCRVENGELEVKQTHLLVRNDEVIYEGPLKSIRRVKQPVNSVKFGQECGIAFENDVQLQVGDVIKCCKSIDLVDGNLRWSPRGF